MGTMNRVRKNFAKTTSIVEIPHLIEMQRISYEKFLQLHVAPDKREDVGLQGIFKSIFPISDFNGTCFLEFVRYNYGDPKYTVEECVERGMTYEVPIKITVRLVTYDTDTETGVQNIRDIKEQEVYLGSVPLMTRDGVFVVNGTERVIVSQLQRSPGLFYAHDNGKTHASGKLLYSARIIPVRGSWIDLEFDVKDVLYVRIDRRRKFPVTTLLRALGYTSEELLALFYKTEKISVKRKKFKKEFDPEILLGQRAVQDIPDPKTGEVLVKKQRKISKALLKKMEEAKLKEFDVEREELLGKYLAHDIVDT